MSAAADWLGATGADAPLRSKWTWLTDQAPPEDPDDLVRAFVLGHCAGVGEPLEPVLVRAVVAARVNVLATGMTGARPELADAMLAMLAADVVPVVPSRGALGAAGSPLLAHILRVACGWGGEAWVGGVRGPAERAMVGLPKIRPTEKDALAWLNGDTLTAAMGAVAIVRARRLLDTAIAACAVSFEVARADLDCLDPQAMDARNQPGPIVVAERLRALLDGSELCREGRRPDPFSLRCAPAVLGAALDAILYVEGAVARELNGAIDNPLVFPGRRPIEAGNFHGAPVAMALDHLKVALTEIASIAERRVFRLTYGQLSGLPSFLVPGTGLNSGLMLAQYTAASLVSECKGLSHPASVDAIPTVQHREDHVSMGPIAARGALRIAEMCADVLAIEMLCAAQGLDFYLSGETEGEDAGVPRRAGSGSTAVHDRVREIVLRWHDDQVMHGDLRKLGLAVRGGVFAGPASAW